MATKYVRITLSESEHHTLRLAAAHRDLDMASFTRAAALSVGAAELKKLASSTHGQEEQRRNATAKRTDRPT